jgi:hypothetical protein
MLATTQIMPTPVTTIPWPDQYRHFATAGESLLQVFKDVEVIRTFKRRAPFRYTAAAMLVTNQRILFLDHANRALSPTATFEREVAGFTPVNQPQPASPSGLLPEPKLRTRYSYGRGRTTTEGTFDVNLDAEWALGTSHNERLHQEFIDNPSAYQKRGAAWWLTGIRDWTSVAGPAEVSGAPLVSGAAVKVPLQQVTAIAQMAFAGPKQRIPVAHVVGDGFLILGDDAKSAVLLSLINDVVGGKANRLFGDGYVARQPAPGMTGASTTYYYVSGVGFAAAIIIGVLWGLNTPSLLMIPLLIGGCIVAFRLLRRWEPRALASVTRERGPGKRP